MEMLYDAQISATCSELLTLQMRLFRCSCGSRPEQTIKPDVDGRGTRSQRTIRLRQRERSSRTLSTVVRHRQRRSSRSESQSTEETTSWSTTTSAFSPCRSPSKWSATSTSASASSPARSSSKWGSTTTATPTSTSRSWPCTARVFSRQDSGLQQRLAIPHFRWDLQQLAATIMGFQRLSTSPHDQTVVVPGWYIDTPRILRDITAFSACAVAISSRSQYCTVKEQRFRGPGHNFHAGPVCAVHCSRHSQHSGGKGSRPDQL
ncbi:hypothetical protein RvY_04086-4 [Ramazzottius varieornatus]|uniref:Uncharacterized protein n=1 Tax=Ramazzottius varieornatus TaxID=947166 RepID=A0A1D1V0F0_RAMVA|nr:hypothetical protein RvY_04086-4 [Ramazzottius varieornatus]